MGKNSTPQHEIIVKHLRKSRDLGKHILKVSNEYGSALISHRFEVHTEIQPGIEMYSKICFLPEIRLYKKGQKKIISDENLLNEDIEDVAN